MTPPSSSLAPKSWKCKCPTYNNHSFGAIERCDVCGMEEPCDPAKVELASGETVSSSHHGEAPSKNKAASPPDVKWICTGCGADTTKEPWCKCAKRAVKRYEETKDYIGSALPDPVPDMQELLDLLEPCLSDDSPPIVSLVKKDARMLISYIRSLESENRKMREGLETIKELASASHDGNFAFKESVKTLASLSNP